MMHIDDYDDEIKEIKRLSVGILFSFKSMSLILGRIVEETGDYDDKYPKSELLKIWGCEMFMFFILFIFSYNVLLIATGPFLFFYAYAFYQLCKAWKRFHYSGWYLTWITLAAVAFELVAAYYLRHLIFG